MYSLQRGRSRQCGSRHPISQRPGVRAFGASEGLQTATELAVWLLLSRALTVFSDYLKQSPLGFPSVGASVIYFLVRSQHSLRKNKGLVKSFSALDKEYCYVSEKISLHKPIKGFKLPFAEASPPRVQSLR